MLSLVPPLCGGTHAATLRVAVFSQNTRKEPLMTVNGATKPQDTDRVDTPAFTPHVDIFETENELLLLADMPGVKPENIDLHFEKGELTMQGKVTPRNNVGYLFHEYAVGDYRRTFAVREEINPTKINAEYKHGVLTVRLPKREEVKPMKISIKAG
jgi:HSP20 family protein